jgi:hypothetical protein
VAAVAAAPDAPQRGTEKIVSCYLLDASCLLLFWCRSSRGPFILADFYPSCRLQLKCAHSFRPRRLSRRR